MTEANIKAAKSILAQQAKTGAPASWGVKEHCAALATRIMECLAEQTEDQGSLVEPTEAKKVKAALRCILETDGIGGNSSQFRQALVKLNLLPKTAAEAVSSYE